MRWYNRDDNGIEIPLGSGGGGGQTIQMDELPTASADLVGSIVQYTGEDASGLGYDLINGHWYKCESWGTGYIWTDLYTDNISNSSKPVISSAVSSALQTKQNIIQVAEMPTASSTRVGDILQYIGTTTASYTNGFFYKCVPGSTSGTYQWTPVSVQSGGGSGADNVVEGYRNDTDGLFYEDNTYTTAITGAENTVYIDLPNDKTYRWNGTTFVRLDDVEPIQYSTMPTASAEYYGKIVQYTGTTTAQYTNGYFYKCDYGSIPSSYRWVQTDVVGISTKENKIIQTPSVTLTVVGWTNNQQTIGTGGVAILDDNRNIIDIPYGDVQTWADCGVMLIGHTTYGTSDEQYIDSLIFQCDTVPDAALTFRLTSMEVS